MGECISNIAYAPDDGVKRDEDHDDVSIDERMSDWRFVSTQKLQKKRRFYDRTIASGTQARQEFRKSLEYVS